MWAKEILPMANFPNSNREFISNVLWKWVTLRVGVGYQKYRWTQQTSNATTSLPVSTYFQSTLFHHGMKDFLKSSGAGEKISNIVDQDNWHNCILIPAFLSLMLQINLNLKSYYLLIIIQRSQCQIPLHDETAYQKRIKISLLYLFFVFWFFQF